MTVELVQSMGDDSSVVHADGTSRVQTVNRQQHPGLYSVLEKFYKKSKIPVLLNTSLNIKGQPMLNDQNDLLEWQKYYKKDALS
jgi:carbamoyltransferase